MQKEELEKMKRQNRKGGPDAWAVDFNENLSGKSVNEEETLQDKAKAFNF